MEPALQRRVQRYGWDKAANYYESFWHHNLKPAQDLLLLMSAITTGEKVIDIACGTGLITFRAAGLAGEKGFVLGTDISEKMIEVCTLLARGRDLANVRFERMDAEALQVPDNSFDCALCALGLMYVPEPSQALKEMHRVVKPGGRATVAVWGQRARCGWAEVFEIVDKRVASEVCPLFFNLGNPNVLETTMRNAGFTQIHSKAINTILSYQSDDEACGAAFAGGPVALAYHKFPEEVKQEVHAEYLASIRNYKIAGGYAIPGEFVVAYGNRE